MNVKNIILDAFTYLVYILKFSAHLDLYSLIMNIFPVTSIFLGRESETFFFFLKIILYFLKKKNTVS